MTNKPMLSVDLRAGLERLLENGYAQYLTKIDAVELQAFLDAPVLESQYAGMTQDQAQAVSAGVDEILHGKPAAQHQPNTGVLYPRCTILKECNVKSSPASDARINAVAKPITRRICHGCVGLPRDVFCPICDGEQPAPVAALITDEQILEAMRPSMMSADGGYVFDTAKQDVIEAGRALLDAAARVEPDNSALLGLLLSGISIDENGFYHLSGINPENFKRAIKASGATLAENIPGHKSPVAGVHTMRSVMEITQEASQFYVPGTSNWCGHIANRLNGVKP